MKRFFAFILCLAAVISLSGCSAQSQRDTDDSEENPAIIEPSDTVLSDEHSAGTDSSPFYETNESDGGYTTTAYMVYLDFEDACALATDVVVASFDGSRPYGSSFTEYSFTVKDRLLGNAPEQINVYAMDVDISVENESVGSYNEQELFLEHDTDYLLVLDHRMSVYNEVDIYQFVCNIVIDVSELSDSTMYNQPIFSHSEAFDFTTSDASDAVEYVRDLVKDNTPSAQPTKTPDIDEVIAASTDILVVNVNECVKSVINDFRNTGFYSCSVTESLKGSISAGETIQILFRNEDVTEGDSIIVALNNHDGAYYYRLTTLNSIISLDQKDALASLIDDAS